MPTKNKTGTAKGPYSVAARFTLEVTTLISGKTFEEAVEHAKAIKIEDFVDFKGEVWSAGEPDITSVWKM